MNRVQILDVVQEAEDRKYEVGEQQRDEGAGCIACSATAGTDYRRWDMWQIS